MKRKIAALLAALLLLTACGGKDAGGSSSASGGGASLETSSQSQTASSGTSEPQPTVAYAPGDLTESSYASDYYGLHFTLPRGCSMMTREELDGMMEAGMGGISAAEEGGATFGELLAVQDATGSNILLLTEQLTVPEDCQGYANLANRQFQNQPGVTLVNDGVLVPAEVGGLPFQKAGYIFDFGEEGGKAYSDTYLYKLGDCMLVLTTYHTGGDEGQKAIETLLGGFEL